MVAGTHGAAARGNGRKRRARAGANALRAPIFLLFPADPISIWPLHPGDMGGLIGRARLVAAGTLPLASGSPDRAGDRAIVRLNTICLETTC